MFQLPGQALLTGAVLDLMRVEPDAVAGVEQFQHRAASHGARRRLPAVAQPGQQRQEQQWEEAAAAPHRAAPGRPGRPHRPLSPAATAALSAALPLPRAGPATAPPTAALSQSPPAPHSAARSHWATANRQGGEWPIRERGVAAPLV